MKNALMFFVMVTLISVSRAWAEIDTVWLTFARETPSHITVSWISGQPGDSTVFYGATQETLEKTTVSHSSTLHHVEIPFPGEKSDWFYRVETDGETSPLHKVKGFHVRELRIAVVGNVHGSNTDRNFDAIRKDEIHLLATAGDNVSGLLSKGIDGDAAKTNIQPFQRFVSRQRDIFATTPFMPVLGNHDRQIRDRGTKENPPTAPVYDIDATAYLSFFPLPKPGWCWKFDLPDFRLRLIALDLNHTTDLGTFLQSSHSYKKGEEQYAWYDRVSSGNFPGLVVTLNNEKNDLVRNREEKSWHEMLRRGTATITGFGHFGERAELDGFPYVNTSVIGKGPQYKDSHTKFLVGRDNYVLLRIPRGGEKLTLQLKALDDGEILDSSDWSARDREQGKER